jgi:integrase
MKKSRAGKIIGEVKKQWEEVTTHTARRTFVTIALFEMNLPPQLVMRITGHKTEKQLFEYARIGKERAALLVARLMDGFF